MPGGTVSLRTPHIHATVRHSRKTSRSLGAASQERTRLTRLLFHPVVRDTAESMKA
jgi:hypothetical protein